MHPEITRILAAERRADLYRRAELRRRARQPAKTGRPAAVGAVRRLLSRLPAVRLAVNGPGRVGSPARPGVFVAGPEAFGVRTYLTAAEVGRLAAGWADLLAEFADRVEDPSRRPPGAVPFEVVVLGRQVPDLAGAAHGLPGPGRAG
ncbi:MAG TPA: hypothetical protein VGF54_21425 [Streptosporangiaceae bacterium]|jgi:hypothetical protein